MNLDLIHVIVLAVVQGISEFLPISSSGHVVIVAELLGIDADVASLNVVLHAGTLLSIVVFYFRRILRLLGQDRRVAWLLVIGTIPAVIVGLLVRIYFRDALEDALLAGAMLVVTGVMLLWISRQPVQAGEYRDLSKLRALGIGAAQAVAILPGISRSGATIGAGIAAGLRRDAAATFSFLLAIPVLIGASALELRDLATSQAGSAPAWQLAVGALISFAVGLAALAWLVRVLERGKLYLFAFWCIPVGLAVVVWRLLA